MVDSVFAQRPDSTEFHEYYATYVGQVPEGNVLESLSRQRDSTQDLLGNLPESKADFRYEPGKWSLKEVVRHLTDAEWIFTNRVLRFARGNTQPLPGMDPDELAAGVAPDSFTLGDVLEEHRHLRSANLRLFSTFDGNVLDRAGEASDRSFTVRSLLWIIAGHELHHLRVIRDRYL